MNTRERSWLRPFSPWAYISQVPLSAVQTALISVFKQWGQPESIKVDNGRPLGDPGSDLVPVMALWLVGLGIDVVWNRPRQPTDNAKVERMQAVTANWAEPEQCADPAMLQRHLDEAAHIQRSLYRCRRLGHQTRAARYPALVAGGAAYAPEAFDLGRVLGFLAKGTWVRKVSQVGQIDFYGQRWQVGAAYRRQQVCLELDVSSQQWVVRDEDDQELKRFASSFISESTLWSLSLSQRTKGDSEESFLQNSIAHSR